MRLQVDSWFFFCSSGSWGTISTLHILIIYFIIEFVISEFTGIYKNSRFAGHTARVNVFSQYIKCVPKTVDVCRVNGIFDYRYLLVCVTRIQFTVFVVNGCCLFYYDHVFVFPLTTLICMSEMNIVSSIFFKMVFNAT